jgi:hypothetical protein
VYILTYTLLGLSHTNFSSKKNLLDNISKLSKIGALNISVWERQCSCEAGFREIEDDISVCNLCETGQMVSDRIALETTGSIFKDDEFIF